MRRILLVAAGILAAARVGLTADLPNLPASVVLAEVKERQEWVREHLLAPGPSRPFSFTYGGQSSEALLASWSKTVSSGALDGNRTEHLLTWIDPQSGLEARCRAVEYQDYPTVEWTLYFKNTGARETPVLSDILALDVKLHRRASDEFVLHYNAGDSCSPGSYEPFRVQLESGRTRRFAPNGGRPTNGSYPYFDLEYDGGGLITVLGWPGQWSAGFERDPAAGLRLTGGQELTRLKLLPG